jgi:tetratricopeptide (TPR) repeat protein
MKTKNTFVTISVTLLLTFIVFLTACYAGEAEKWYDEGVKYADYHKYGKALECFNKAISLKPDFAMAYNERGYVYYELVRYEEAIADYTKSISLDPDYPGAYYNRAYLLYFELEDYDAAVLDLTESIKLAPDHADSHAMRGHAYKDLGKYEEALKDYTKACELGSRNACDHLKLLKEEMGLIPK